MQRSLLLTGLFILLYCSPAMAQGWLWATGSSCPYEDCEGMAVAVDKSGNTYAIGTTILAGTTTPPVVKTIFGADTIIDNFNSTEQGVIVSLDSAGHVRWAKGTQGGRVFMNSIKTDDSGNVYVLGDASLTSGFTLDGIAFTNDGFMIKMNSAGTVQWIRDVPYGSGDFRINQNGSFYMIWNNIMFGKFDHNLNLIWADTIKADTTIYRGGFAITADSQVYVAGTFYSDSITIGSSTLHNYTPRSQAATFLAKFDAVGHPLWATSPHTDSLYPSAIAADPHGNAYLAGSYSAPFRFASDSLRPPGIFGETYLFKYTSGGTPLWARSVAYPTMYAVSDLFADNCGSVWMCGRMPFNSSFDSLFMLHFDTLGHIFDTVITSSGGDDQAGFAFDGKGNLFICGDYYNRTRFGATILPKDSSDEALFVAKYKYGYPDCTRDTIRINYYAGIENVNETVFNATLFPNPNNGTFTIRGDDALMENAKAEIYDLAGHLVGTYLIPHNNTELTVNNLPAGMYQLRITSRTNATAVLKMVVMK